MTPFSRIERDQENCTWKWIGKMVGLPAGAASRIYLYGKRLEAVLGRLPQSEKELREVLEGRYAEKGWYRSGNYGASVSLLKELSSGVGLKSFEVGGKFYVKA